MRVVQHCALSEKAMTENNDRGNGDDNGDDGDDNGNNNINDVGKFSVMKRKRKNGKLDFGKGGAK